MAAPDQRRSRPSDPQRIGELQGRESGIDVAKMTSLSVIGGDRRTSTFKIDFDRKTLYASELASLFYERADSDRYSLTILFIGSPRYKPKEGFLDHAPLFRFNGEISFSGVPQMDVLNTHFVGVANVLVVFPQAAVYDEVQVNAHESHVTVSAFCTAKTLSVDSRTLSSIVLPQLEVEHCVFSVYADIHPEISGTIDARQVHYKTFAASKSVCGLPAFKLLTPAQCKRSGIFIPD